MGLYLTLTGRFVPNPNLCRFQFEVGTLKSERALRLAAAASLTLVGKPCRIPIFCG